MFPFRELEVFDSFMLHGMECDKVGTNKYLVYDELGEPESLEVADPDMMVEFMEEEEEEEGFDDLFFSSLLNFLDGMEEVGEKMTIKNLRKFARDFLSS